MRFSVSAKTKRDRQTDGRTDGRTDRQTDRQTDGWGGGVVLLYLPSRASGAAGDNKVN